MCICMFETELASSSLLVLGALGIWKAVAWRAAEFLPREVSAWDAAVGAALHAALAAVVLAATPAPKDALTVLAVGLTLTRTWWRGAQANDEPPGGLAWAAVSLTWAAIALQLAGHAALPVVALAVVLAWVHRPRAMC